MGKHSREKEIMKASVVGIVVNVMLSAMKFIVGIVTNSMAVTMDAVNNLSDALSSVITIVGMFLAGRPADKKHPYGRGRIEYFSSMTVAAIVIVTGTSLLIESVKKIVHPEQIDYTTVTIGLMVIAIVVKLILGLYVKKKGEENNADSLVAAGSDAMSDSVITLSTVIAALINFVWNINIDGILGAIISVFIMKSGIEIFLNASSSMVGIRIDAQLSKEIKDCIREHEGVLGAYDLVLHNYGPENYIGSVHIEVKDVMTAWEVSELSQRIRKSVADRFGIFLTIGIYAIATQDEKAARITEYIKENITKLEHVLEVHGIRVDNDSKKIYFDIVVDFEVEDRKKLMNEIIDKVQGEFMEYKCTPVFDIDVSD